MVNNWDVIDLLTLADLHPSIAAVLDKVKLTGSIEGTASAAPGANGCGRLAAKVEIPADTQLSIGDNLTKPQGEAVQLDITGTADEKKQAVSDIKMSLAIGKTTLGMNDGSLCLYSEKTDPDAELTGTFDAAGLEHLCEWLPENSPFRRAVRGSLNGEINLLHDGDLSELYLCVNMDDLAIEKNDFFVKTENEPAEFIVKSWVIIADDGTPQGDAQITMSLGNAEMEAVVMWLNSDIRQSEDIYGTTFFGNIDILDAGWLTDHCPTLAGRMKGGKLSGPMSAIILGGGNADTVEFSLGVKADKVDLAVPGKYVRTKRADVPMAVGAKCTLQKSGSLTTLVVKNAKVIIDKNNSLEVSGEAVFDDSDGRAVVKKFNAGMTTVITAGETLYALLPELAESARRCSAAGSVTASAAVSGDENHLSCKAGIDAANLSFDELKLLESEADDASDPAAAVLVDLCRLAKPTGLPASVKLELSAQSDWSKIKINNLLACIGDLELLADGDVSLTLDAGGLPVGAELTDAHIALSASRLDRIAAFLPALDKSELAGYFAVETELTGSGGTIEIPYVSAIFSDITGLADEKEFLLSGDLVAEKISIADGRVSVGRVWTEGVKLNFGGNRTWLICDIANVTGGPTGTVDVLAEQIDDREIMNLLARFTPDGRADDGFGEEAEKHLADTAQQAIDAARPLLMSADFKVRLSIDRMLTFDKSIEQLYDVRYAQAELTVQKGRVTASYDAGLNGGMLRTQMTTHLADDEPIITRSAAMLDLVAAENLQPQLARFFPGNICRGSFTRTENVQMPLRDMLANVMDARYTLHPTGEAKTITTDGTIIGKGAPDFVTAVFPGLNLTKYNYKKMTGFAEFIDDGSAVNDMVFSGAYDIYIEGVTDVDNIGRYQVGIILLGSPQSPEWNHLYKQGRLPILKWKAKIENGKLYDEEVQYPWPNETLFTIVLKNNYFYRLWLNRDKSDSSATQTQEPGNQ